MKRREFLAVAAGPLVAQQTKAPQNVVLIVVDDLGYKDLGCYGTREYPVPYETPQVDAMAKESTLFTRFYAACPVCSPTRASILTGKYPVRTGITDWIPGMAPPKGALLETPPTRNELALEEKTIAEYLKPLGYATASFGKWHLGGAGFEPTKQGFDLNIGGDHTGQPNAYLPPFRMPGLGDAPEGAELTEYLTGKANAWIAEQAKARRPFFLYLPHFGVHTPLGGKAELIAKYTGRPGVRNPIYAAMVEAVDRSLGMLRAQLASSGVADDTLIVFTSDNGALVNVPGREPATSIDPLREQKGWLYEGGIRVPCVIHDPRNKKGAVVEQPGCSIDLLPTILKWLGQAVPRGIDGTPLVGRQEQPTYYWHYPHYHGAGGRPGGAVIDGDYKLIEHYETGKTEVYDLRADVAEKRDLSGVEPARRSSLYLKLRRWREETKALMPVKARG
jgi:arylsulfatase A-like enzyme